jgi:hypothetical protein
MEATPDSMPMRCAAEPALWVGRLRAVANQARRSIAFSGAPPPAESSNW